MMSSKLRLLLVFSISVTVIIGLFLLVNPEDKPLIYVFIPVLLLWVALFSFVRLLTEIFIDRPGKLHRVIAATGVSFAVLLFLLSGIGQLTAVDFILLLVLGVISVFYFYRAWS